MLPPPADYRLSLLHVSPRLRLLALLGVLACFGGSVGSYLLLRHPYPDAALLTAIGVPAIGLLAGLVAYVRATQTPSLVQLTATHLTVHDLRQQQPTLRVPYADVAAYRHQTLNGTEELRLTLRTGERVVLRSASNLDLKGEFARLVRAFEQQLTQLPAPAAPAGSPAPPAPPVREKGFLETPLATGLLLAATAVLALLAWQVAAGHLLLRQVAGAGPVYLSFLAAWLVARRRAA